MVCVRGGMGREYVGVGGLVGRIKGLGQVRSLGAEGWAAPHGLRTAGPRATWFAYGSCRGLGGPPEIEVQCGEKDE